MHLRLNRIRINNFPFLMFQLILNGLSKDCDCDYDCDCDGRNSSADPVDAENRPTVIC
jgi:hypothetical protein